MLTPSVLERLTALDPALPSLVRFTLRHIPATTALVVYGSRVRGQGRPRSDYDLLVISPQVPDFEQRTRIEHHASVHHFT